MNPSVSAYAVMFLCAAENRVKLVSEKKTRGPRSPPPWESRV